MNSVLIIALLAVIAGQPLRAQGFDWQPTPRRPYTAPTSFVGLDVGIGRSAHSSSLPYLEKDIAGACCTYEQGNGSSFRIGLAGERWIAPTMAVGLEFGFESHSAKFLAPEQSLPRSGRNPLVSRYELDVQVNYLGIGALLRQRLWSSMAVASVGIRGGILLGATMTNREVVVGPVAETFSSGRREEILPTAGLDDASAVVLRPFLSIGYDLPLMTGYYVQPALSIGYTLNSISSLHRWHAATIGIGLRLMKGR